MPGKKKEDVAMEAAKDVSAVVSFIVNALKESAVRGSESKVNTELLTEVFNAGTMKDFRAIVNKYSTKEILSVAGAETIYYFYCQYFGCNGGTYKILEYLVGAKKAGKKRRCLV